MKKLILIQAFLLCALANTKSVDFSQNEVTLNKNQCSIEITNIDENPSTGFSWNAAYDDKIFYEPKKDFILSAQKAGVVGAGGKSSFLFYMKKSSCNSSDLTESEIKFALPRPWENSPAKTKTILIKFNYSK